MRPRVRVWSNVKMVTLQGAIVRHDGEATLLEGVTDGLPGGVCAVKLDDGRELLIAREHLEAIA